MYAIIETGGKQYKAEKGTRLQVEKLEQEDGSTITIDKVLLVKDGASLKIGKPTVAGASVTAEVVRTDRAKKIIVFKKRSKKTYKKTQGHRQYFTELLIKDITG